MDERFTIENGRKIDVRLASTLHPFLGPSLHLKVLVPRTEPES